jgi:undecaprenyl-diphosphatase
MRFRLTPPVFACLAVFVGISMLVVSGVTLPWDDAVLQWVGTMRSPGLTDGMLVATFLGNGLVEVPIALGVVALLWVRAGRRSALALLLAGVSGEVIYGAAKAAFHRPRPDVIDKLSSAGWYSYPSGHAMMAPILWSLMLVLLARTFPARGRWPLVVLALAMPLAIAVSRVYLGVHYPSDVLGALALGSAWLLLWLGWAGDGQMVPVPPATGSR